METRNYNPAYLERGHHEDEHEHEEDHDDHEEHEHEAHDDDHDDDHDDHDDHEEHEHEIPDAVERTFTGASAAIGLHVDTWRGGAFVTNLSRSFRAPSLEELYNFGPHFAERAFEVGDPTMGAEVGNGFDMSLRHDSGRVRAELDYFYYGFENFLFPFATGEFVDELLEIEYTQMEARFTGMEASVDLGVHESAWINLGLDYVDAKNLETGTYLPRIPPLRFSVGVDLRKGGFRVTPKLIFADRQSRTFTGETETPSYVVANLDASYTLAKRHATHQFAFSLFNIGDRLYRSHTSFIKDLAPEIGRGIRFSYVIRFF